MFLLPIGSHTKRLIAERFCEEFQFAWTFGKGDNLENIIPLVALKFLSDPNSK